MREREVLPREARPRRSLITFLEVMSQLAGSDIGAVEQGDEDTGVIVMRDPQYAINDVLIALIAEIRRLRWLCLRDYKMP